MVQAEASLMSLELNHAKSELICDDALACNVVLSAFPGLQTVPLNHMTLLGAPLGNIDMIDSTIAVKVKKLNLIGERLRHLSSQDTLLILRNSIAIPKVLYILRTAPCYL